MISKIMVFLFVVFIGTAINIDKITLGADCSDSNYARVNESICRDELRNIEAEEKQLLAQVENLDKQSKNYASELKKLNLQIQALKTKIKARSLVIAQLKVSINEKVSKIQTLSEKIEREHASLAQLLRNTNEFDNENLVHLILSSGDISDFYSDFESYLSIKEAVKESTDIVKGIKKETEVAKTDLEKKQNAETDAKAELENAEKNVKKTETEKKQLLAISEKDKAAFQKLATQKKIQADRIRAALFPLAGISQKIDFGTALAYANTAKAKFGIEPAFLLAILTQESNLGANVGQCYLTNTETGAGVGKNTGRAFSNVMKPGRDVPPFLEITGALKLNAFQTAISCPVAGVAGWGGAMGPAQFIPSTWKLFMGRLEEALGHYPSPWVPEDAFMASSMYLTDLGAVGTSQSAQNIAACKYYGSGGSSCAYSRSVKKLKENIQANIDLLSS